MICFSFLRHYTYILFWVIMLITMGMAGRVSYTGMSMKSEIYRKWGIESGNGRNPLSVGVFIWVQAVPLKHDGEKISYRWWMKIICIDNYAISNHQLSCQIYYKCCDHANHKLHNDELYCASSSHTINFEASFCICYHMLAGTHIFTSLLHLFLVILVLI